MRLESLRPDDFDQAQEELEELAQRLLDEGYAVEIAPPGGPVRVILERSAEQAVVDVLNVVLDEVESHAIDVVVGAVVSALMDWARRRRGFGSRSKGQATGVIWGPDGKVIRRVPLPESENGSKKAEGD